MTDLRTAAQQALEALEMARMNGEAGLHKYETLQIAESAEALRAALAEPPVDDPHRDHWVAIAEAAQKIAASTECGLAEAKALCAALDRLTDAALAEPGQEPKPVAWMFEFPDKRIAPKFDSCPHGGNWVPLYTTPPQRKPLPASDIVTMYDESPTGDSDMIAFARAIEAKHGIT